MPDDTRSTHTLVTVRVADGADVPAFFGPFREYLGCPRVEAEYHLRTREGLPGPRLTVALTAEGLSLKAEDWKHWLGPVPVTQLVGPAAIYHHARTQEARDTAARARQGLAP